MQFIVRKYYSGYCTFEVEADNEDQAYEMVNELPVKSSEVLWTLEPWEACDEIERVGNN